MNSFKTWLRRAGRGIASSYDGFTLVELMVIIAIVGILLIISFPTFRQAQNRAQDRAAHAVLRDSLTTAKVYYADNENYGVTSSDAAFESDLEALTPSINFGPMATASQSVVGFVRGDQQVVFTLRSTTGIWFCISDDAAASVSYDSDSSLADVDTAAECDQGYW
ncbi:MAG: type IV pilin protein [Acidimicrobiia bacterium]